MTQCRDLENRHHEKLLEISISALEKSLNNELDEELPDDVREVRTAENSPPSVGVMGRGGGRSLCLAGTGFPGGSVQLELCLTRARLNCSTAGHSLLGGMEMTALQVSLGSARAGGSNPRAVLSKFLSCLQHSSLPWLIFKPQPSRHSGSFSAALAAGFVLVLPAPHRQT